MKLVSWMICASLLGSVTVAAPVAAATVVKSPPRM